MAAAAPDASAAEAKVNAAAPTPVPQQGRIPRPLKQCHYILENRKRLRNKAVASAATGAAVGGALGHSLGSALFPQGRGAWTAHVPSTTPSASEGTAARSRYERMLGGMWRLPGLRWVSVRRPVAVLVGGIGLGLLAGLRVGLPASDWQWLRDNANPSRAEMDAAERVAAAESTLVGGGALRRSAGAVVASQQDR